MSEPRDLPDGLRSPEGLRGVARERVALARRERDRSHRWARWHQFVHYAVGILGIVAGSVAGVSGFADTRPTLAGTAAFVAAAATAAATFLNQKRLSNGHWKRAAGFETLAQDYETLAADERAPTRADLEALSGRWQRLDEPAPEG